MNSYWTAVLQEVLHKNDPNYPIRFTNVRERGQQAYEIARAAKAKPVARNKTRYYVELDSLKTYLTHRETLSVLHRMQGKTYAQTAEILKIKKRTVEFYLKSIRDKLHCERASEVLKVLSETDFFKNYQLQNGQIQIKK